MRIVFFWRCVWLMQKRYEVITPMSKRNLYFQYIIIMSDMKPGFRKAIAIFERRVTYTFMSSRPLRIHVDPAAVPGWFALLRKAVVPWQMRQVVSRHLVHEWLRKKWHDANLNFRKCARPRKVCDKKHLNCDLYLFAFHSYVAFLHCFKTCQINLFYISCSIKC